MEVVSLTLHRPEFKHVIHKCKEKWEVKVQPKSEVFLLRKKERRETEFSAKVEPFGWSTRVIYLTKIIVETDMMHTTHSHPSPRE